MRSLGYLLLFSLIVTLTSGAYLARPRCPQQLPDVDFGGCQQRNQCAQDTDCGRSQSCCKSGCSLQCLSFLNPFSGMFSWLSNMGGGCSGCGSSSSGCSGCGSNGGSYASQYGKSYK